MIQRVGRAARDRNLQGFGVLYVPPVNKTHSLDSNVHEFIMSHINGMCLWKFVDKLFENNRTCNKTCSGCLKVDRLVSIPIFYNTKSSSRGRWPRRSKEEKQMALEALLAWRKDAYERWVEDRPFRIGAETWILPDSVAKQLSQKFSQIRTAEAVVENASQWRPRGGDIWFSEVAGVLDELNNEIDARRESCSQMMPASAAQSEDDSDGNQGSGGEHESPESK